VRKKLSHDHLDVAQTAFSRNPRAKGGSWFDREEGRKETTTKAGGVGRRTQDPLMVVVSSSPSPPPPSQAIARSA